MPRACAGISTVSRVPLPGPLSSRRSPRSCATRSRMPTRPMPRDAPGAAHLLGPEPDPIVFDRDQHRVGQPLQEDAARRGLGVLGDVGQRLLHDAIDPGLGFGREPFIDAVLQQLDADAVPAAEPLQVPLDRRRQAEVVEHRGMEEPRQVADGVQRPLGDPARVVQRVDVDARGLHRSLRHREFDFDRRQYLADFVVQLARDAPPLLFLRGQQLRGQPLQVAGRLDVPGAADAEGAARDGPRRGSRSARSRYSRRARGLRSARPAAAWRDRATQYRAAAARRRCD